MDQRANRCGFQVEDQWGHCLGAPMSCLCSGNCFRRELPAGVVDGVGRIEDQLTDGHNGIPVVDQAVEDGRQGLRRVQRSVVEQHDAPRLHLGCTSDENLTYKRGVWRVIQVREGSKSRGCAQGREVVGKWGRMRYTKNKVWRRPLLNIALTWSKMPLLPWITDAAAYFK